MISVRAASFLCLASALAAQDPVQDPAELLQQLSVEQKAGQLFMSWSLSRSAGAGDDNNHVRLAKWVEEVGLGGVILSLGTCEDAAKLIPELQRRAKVPLLLAGDFEGGVWFRLDGATELGNQMLVGATGSAALAEQMGRITGEQAKALGFHWVFAPVLDVNSNPQNPIINVRSFGEDPRAVARLGSAFASGVRQAGLMACGKHFPGHGDVDSDSHLELPTVPGDSARLHEVELLPFAQAAREGLESVMTGHLAVPGLGELPNVPATLSRKILHDVLRDELGFTGLVVTDALEMGGVKNAFAPGEVAVRALLAGADVLLMPPDPYAARDAVVAAVQSGRVPMARLDDAVRRILAMKQRVGLLNGEGRVAGDWRQRVDTAAARAVADRIAERGLVLVRERDYALPFAEESHSSRLLLTLVDKDEGQGQVFAAGLDDRVAKQLRLSPDSSAEELAAAIEAIGDVGEVVVALYCRVREYQGGVGVPPKLRPVLEALQDEQSVAVVSFGNPYLIRDLPRADAYLAAFVSTGPVERAAARALRGEASLFGRLPVSIPGVAAVGHGLTKLIDVEQPWPALPPVEPAEVEMDAALPTTLRRRLEAAVAKGAFPGAVCVVARHGRVVAEVAVGQLGYEPDAAPVRPDTRFDLASLTKVCATTPAVLRLIAAGKLSLDDPVQKWVPAFVGEGKAVVTIRHLLAHQGGLPAYERYYRTMQGKDAIVAAAAAEGLMSEPGTSYRYSDLGFILLMAVVEAASGESFADYVQREVLTRFGMVHAMWAPTSAAPLAGAAPTERDEARGGIVQGYVHDENAFAMGGISGHAGLFATAGDVVQLGVALLAGGRDALPRELVERAIAPAGFANDRSRGLGYQLLQSGGYGGTSVPAGTFGHTGFTGTSLWCSPQHDLCVVLLTNRVHPTRVNDKITAVRRAVHDLVLDALR